MKGRRRRDSIGDHRGVFRNGAHALPRIEFKDQCPAFSCRDGAFVPLAGERASATRPNLCNEQGGAPRVFQHVFDLGHCACRQYPEVQGVVEPRGFRHLLLPICSGNVNEGSIDLLVIGCATCGKQQHANSEAACSSHVHWPLLHHPMRPLPVLTMVPSSVMALNSLSNTPFTKALDLSVL